MRLGDKGETVRLGIIGLGGRGLGQMETLLQMPDVEISALCDLFADRLAMGQEMVYKHKGNRPVSVDDYRKVIYRDDVDAVMVFTSWESHASICVQAMRAGKPTAVEAGGTCSVEACWELVRAHEETGVECMMLENCCYDKREMALLNMVRMGLFGDIVHCEGGYEHDLRDEIGLGDINRQYRQRHFLHRDADLYPTHGLGPIAKYLDLNRGNRMVSLVSMSTKAMGLSQWLQANRAESELSKARVNQGDIVRTLIKCANGEMITLTHGCTLPRPYSRNGRIQGTKAIWLEDSQKIYMENRSPKKPIFLEMNSTTVPTFWSHEWENEDEYLKTYEHPLWKEYEAFGKRGGHGGMDYLVLRAFVESVQKNECPPIDTYDTASWMAITALSEQSIALGSMPVAIPDFTNGKWISERVSVPTGEYVL